MTASQNDTLHSEAPRAPSGAGQGGAPLYFPVSLTKLAVMSVFTLGLYEFYWFYKNWRIVKAREAPGIAQAWHVLPSLARTFFAVLFCYSLFARIRESADEQDVPLSFAAGFLTVGWIVTSFLGGLPDPYGLVSLFSVVFLIPAQDAVNRINQTASPAHDPNARFTTANKAWIVVGVLLLALALYGALSSGFVED